MNFEAVFSTTQGHRIYASRKVAEKIEVQTRYAAELNNVDVRQDQRYLAEKDLFPCGDRDESRFSPDFEVPLIGLGMEAISSQQAQYFLRLSEYDLIPEAIQSLSNFRLLTRTY